LARDTLVVIVALGLLVYEVVWGGGRPAILTTLGGLLLSPLLMRVDKVRSVVAARREDDADDR
jgi:hypothetical protein